MAETTDVPVLNETLNATAENVTGKIPSTPEGMAIAYSSLVIMALIPIYLGSFRSVRYHKEQKVRFFFSTMHTRFVCSSLSITSSTHRGSKHTLLCMNILNY